MHTIIEYNENVETDTMLIAKSIPRHSPHKQIDNFKIINIKAENHIYKNRKKLTTIIGNIK